MQLAANSQLEAGWVPATLCKRWDGDDGESLPPIASFLEDHNMTDILSELQLNEIFTLETLMLLTDVDLVEGFTPSTQLKLANALGKVLPIQSTAAAAAAAVNMQQLSVPGGLVQQQVCQVLPAMIPVGGQQVQFNPSLTSPVQPLLANETFSDVVQQLVEERERARRVKDYSKADSIREQLRKQGIRLNDDNRTWLHPNGATGGIWGKQETKVR
eukprot:TRINITY_DN20338_c0_g1_i1.p1 TRINITY_DN20338_c0_g1~~TRINITY_DN20338_c0_g1_i1.p1  ORF type:complete len:222 (+),score=64.91 TRINITY_DN20338_c0_g1_i1:24-668(+)